VGFRVIIFIFLFLETHGIGKTKEVGAPWHCGWVSGTVTLLTVCAPSRVVQCGFHWVGQCRWGYHPAFSSTSTGTQCPARRKHWSQGSAALTGGPLARSWPGTSIVPVLSYTVII
jgi:hypothetical protein